MEHVGRRDYRAGAIFEIAMSAREIVFTEIFVVLSIGFSIDGFARSFLSWINQNPFKALRPHNSTHSSTRRLASRSPIFIAICAGD